MDSVSELSGAQAIILTTQLCADSNISGLQRLHTEHPQKLYVEILLRIVLTFLPESTEPSLYTPFLKSLAAKEPEQNVDGTVDISPIKDLTEADARKRVRKLHLRPLAYEEISEHVPTDPLTQFIIHRAHRVDAETGLLPLLLQLTEPFVNHSEYLRTWLISTLLPLLRFNYEYYPEDDSAISLDAIEALDGGAAVNTLLSKAEQEGNDAQIGRDLRGLIGPWMYGNTKAKRRKLDEGLQERRGSMRPEGYESNESQGSVWQLVNEWMVSTSLKDFPLSVKAVEEWGGPRDVDLGDYDGEDDTVGEGEAMGLNTKFGQAAFAAVYATDESSPEALEGSHRILRRVVKLLDYDPPPDMNSSATLPNTSDRFDSISNLSRASMLHNALLLPHNSLTLPSSESVLFLNAILISARILKDLDYPISCRAAAEICLFSDEATQKAELQKIMQRLARESKSSRDWRTARTQLLWLRTWQEDCSTVRQAHGIFWRVERMAFEMEFLKALLTATRYLLAIEVYAEDSSKPLPPDQVELVAQEAILSSYDNTSNGNRTRGGMKKASYILWAFRPLFPNSISFQQIDALLSATHALSFYSLTLQHGVPFQPVSIRVHHDPISLIGKVLEQNPKSYTKLDDLLFIGRNLVAAGLPTTSDNASTNQSSSASTESENTNSRVLNTECRIISIAISAALADNDFGTAYSYVITRLDPPALSPDPSNSPSNSPTDDISWRAAFNAGRHRPQATSPGTITSQIHILSQRMELLSLALVLAPSPDPLPEVLGAWRRCDEEMSVLRTRETEEEENWDAQGDRSGTLPGGFAPSESEADAMETERAKRAKSQKQRGVHKEAPMGLFDVARGAARAIGKSAFPLRNSTVSTGEAEARDQRSHGVGASDGSGSEGRVSTEETRVRKRDMVSNMVTGGLASGIGWVLGAPPVNK